MTAESPAPPPAEPERRPESPHDKLAKFTFRELPCARAELAFAVGRALAALIDWDSLALEPTELIDEVLAHRFADLRFTARLRGLPVRFDVVFEHQSDHDAQMPVRCFCHTGAIWNEARRQKRNKMPFVLNVVLHTGPAPWTSMDLWRNIEHGEQLKEVIPTLLPTSPIVLDDLAQSTDAQIRARGMSPQVTLALLALKHGRPDEMVQALRDAGDLLSATPEGALRETVRYALRVESKENLPAIGETLKRSLGQKESEAMMTAADHLIEVGRQEGLRQGTRLGRVEEGRRALVRVIRVRGWTLTEEQQALVGASEDPDQLARWSDAAETAACLNEVFEPVTH